MWVCGLDWAGPGQGQVADACECGNEPSGSIKCGEFLDYLTIFLDYLTLFLDYLTIFRKHIDNIEVSLQTEKNNRYFTCRPIHIFYLSRSVLLRMRNVSDKSCRENQNTCFVLNNFLRKSCLL